MPSTYYKRLGSVNLGDLSKINAFVDYISHNITKLNNYPVNTEIQTNMSLDVGTDLICMRYGKDRFFYTIKGEVLTTMFDDWDKIQDWIESHVGNTLNKYPILSCSGDHIYKHIDVRRSASVNMGLYNSDDSTMCFWDNNKLVSHVQYKTGEAILASVRNEHSVIVNDYMCDRKFRAILMWTAEKNYNDI